MSVLEHAEQTATYLRNFHWERYGDTASEAEPHRTRLERQLSEAWEALVASLPELTPSTRAVIREVAQTLRYQGDPASLSGPAREALTRFLA